MGIGCPSGDGLAQAFQQALQGVLVQIGLSER